MASCPEVVENLGGFTGPVPDGAKVGIDVSTGTVYIKGPTGNWTPATTSGGGTGGGGGATAVDTIGITLDGTGSGLTTGQKGYVRVPFNATITEWSIISKESGSIVFTIWKAAGGVKPISTDSITPSGRPTLSVQEYNSATPPVGWTTLSISAGDILGWNVESTSGTSWVVLQLTVTKT